MIADSSVLIIFARINRIGILNQLYGIIHVPRSVYDEIVENADIENCAVYHKSGHGDAPILKKAFSEGLIAAIEMDSYCKKLSENLQTANPQIANAEADVIALATEKKTIALIDEHPARITAKLQGVKCIGSLGTLLAAFSKGLITENETKTILQTILRENFRISPIIVSEFYEEIERIKKRR